MISSNYKNIIWCICILILSLLSHSCSKVPNGITIKGDFNEGDSLSVLFCLKSTQNYEFIKGSFVSRAMSELKEVSIPINPFNENITALGIRITAKQDHEVSIRSIEIGGVSLLTAEELDEAMWWQENINLSYNSSLKSLTSHVHKDITCMFSFKILPFYYAPYKKVSWLAILFVISSFILLLYSLRRYKQLAFPLLVISISLYIACFVLKISWGNWMLPMLAIATIAYVKLKGFQIKYNFILWSILWLFLIYLIGMIYTVDTDYNWGKLILVSTVIVFVFIFSIISLTKNEVIFILRFFVLFTILYCTYALVSYISAIPLLGLSSIKDSLDNAKVLYHFLFAYPSFSHPSFITIIITMGIPFAIYLKKEKEMGWPCLLLSITLISLVVLLSGARIGLIIIPILLSLGLLFYIKIPPYIKYILVIGSSIIILSAVKMPSSINNTIDDFVRRDLRRTAITAIKEKPFWGWGTSSMETLLLSEDIAQKASLEKPIARYGHFHNQYLDMLIQFGFVGSFPFFVFFAYLIFLAIKRKDFLLMAYLAIYLSFMYVESPFATAKGIQPMMFWICFLLSTQKVRLNQPNL